MKMRFGHTNRSTSRRHSKLNKFLTSRLKIESNNERSKPKRHRILIREF